MCERSHPFTSPAFPLGGLGGETRRGRSPWGVRARADKSAERCHRDQSRRKQIDSAGRYRYKCGGRFNQLEPNCVDTRPNGARVPHISRSGEAQRSAGIRKKQGCHARLDRKALGLFSLLGVPRKFCFCSSALRSEEEQAATARADERRPLTERARPLRL